MVRTLLVVGLIALTGCTNTTPEKEGPVTTPDGFSRLDAAGVEQIQNTREARFDLRDLRLTKEDVGLGADRLGPQVGKPGGPELELTLLGPEGTEKVTTSTFMVTFFSTSPTAQLVTWFESHRTRAEGDRALGAAVDHWGLPPDTVDNWQETVKLASRGPFADTSGTTRTSYGPGLAESGLVGEVTVSTKPDREGETIQYQVLLDPKYYTKESLQRLRARRR